MSQPDQPPSGHPQGAQVTGHDQSVERKTPKADVLRAAGADAPKGTSPVRQKVHRKGCDDESMRWLVELEASREDIERLLAESPEGLFATEDPLVALLEILDPEHENNTDEARAVGRTLIDAAVRRWNGFGKLRWGRSFGGVTAGRTSYVAADGARGQVMFVGTAYAHLLPEEYGDMMERLGFERPLLPDGLGDVNALNLTAVVELAEDHPEIARVLRLIELMLLGDDQIDWASGYAALEVIEQSARNNGVNGQELGWWTRKNHERFRQMANSFEAGRDHVTSPRAPV